MRILVTGSAGFIGAALAQALLVRGDEVVGVDNHNDYYEVSLKEARLARFENHPRYTHERIDLAKRVSVDQVFEKYQPQRVVNLAAQAGVRYSLDNPTAYVDSNIVGFTNILEGCRHYDVQHLVYASSSSVYGANTVMPFSVRQNVDHPLSMYAASKKANELMAHAYSHLFNLPTTGLRFFTVYGPWSRPDMAMIKFAEAIYYGKPIDVYNYGKHRRDFTYIDDVVKGIIRAIDSPAQGNVSWSGSLPDAHTSLAPWRVYNIGSSKPIEVLYCIQILEKALGKSTTKNLLPMQPGDIPATYANVDELVEDLGYQPQMPIELGVQKFAEWYLEYYCR